MRETEFTYAGGGALWYCGTTLKTLGLLDVVKDKVMLAENVGGAFSMILSGSAELGFVALSQVLGSEKGKSGPALELIRAAEYETTRLSGS